jgi:undecaprenyl-diphosphatase
MEIEITFLNMLQDIRSAQLDNVMIFVTRLADKGALWLAMAASLLIRPSTRRAGIAVLIAMAIELILCNVILKNVFGRIRPFDVNTTIELLIRKPRDYSFQSGHTAVSFAAATSLYLCGYNRLCILAFVIATMIAFSRMYLYVHYPTDIIGGVVVGIVSGYLGYVLANKLLIV